MKVRVWAGQVGIVASGVDMTTQDVRDLASHAAELNRDLSKPPASSTTLGFARDMDHGVSDNT